jgi:BirA family biotin operon repressor/biotin-[acetyl-CoA-carboxylase] ligase
MDGAAETLPILPPPFSLAAHDRVGSTSDEAKILAGNGAPHGRVVWAREQTGGRGRLNRRWVSPRGNLFTSVVLRPQVGPARAAELGFVAAVAVARTIADCLPASSRVALKWPNDVLVEGAKIAGILLEARSGPVDLVDWVVLGIGINVVAAPDETPYPATCLAQQGASSSVAGVLERLIRELGSWVGRWEAEGFAPIRAAWLAQAHGLGETVDIRHGGDPLSGRFLDLDRDGALILETPAGTRRITAGDVHFPAA